MRVDEAQFLSPAVPEEIRGLLNCQCDAFAPFDLVLLRVVDHALVKAVMATEWETPEAAGR